MTTQSLERVYRITADATQAINQLDRIAKSTGNIDSKMSNLGNSIQSAFGRLAAVAGVATFGKSVLTASENVENLQGSFKALLGDGDRAADMLERVYKIVENTGADIGTVSQSVQRLAIGLKEVGATNSQIQTIAENFIKLGRVGGSSIQDISGALLQFNQGLASGRLQGDELRSIMERVPGIIQLIAKEMGVSTGEVKKLGSEGKITADIMSNALLKATKEINDEFAELPVTFEQSMNKLGVTWNKFLVEVGKVSKIMELVSVSIDYVDDGLKNVNSSMSAIGLIGETLKVVFQTVAVLASDIGFVITGLASDVARLVAVTGAALNGDFKKIPEIWAKTSEEQEKSREELEKFQAQILGTAPIVKKLGDELGDAGGNIDLISSKLKGELNPALKELQDLGQKRLLAIESIALLEKLSPEAISRLAISAKDVANAIEKLQAVADPADAALRKFAVSAQNAVNPFNELATYLDQLNQALEKGYISWDTYAEATLKAMDKMEPEKLKETKNALDEIGVAIGNSIASGVNQLVDSFFEADKSFKQFASNFLTQIGKMIIQMLILAQIKRSLEGTSIGSALGFAKGGAFNGSTGLPQGVYSEPTFFKMPGAGLTKFANGGVPGMGVLAEAGRSEAIVPLVRHGGDLGVKASPVNISINNNMSETANVQIQETNKADGTREISVLIEKRVKELFANGSMDKQMRGAYGLSRTPA